MSATTIDAAEDTWLGTVTCICLHGQFVINVRVSHDGPVCIDELVCTSCGQSMSLEEALSP